VVVTLHYIYAIFIIAINKFIRLYFNFHKTHVYGLVIDNINYVHGYIDSLKSIQEALY